MHLTARRPKITVSADGTGIVSQAGGLLLTRTLRATGLDHGLSAALERWRPGRAVHSPGKIITDLAVTLALGGDCLADVAMLRAQPELFGPVASDPVVSRLVTRLAADAPRALKAIRAARAAARDRARDLAGDAAPGADGGLVTVDIDATIVTSCSDKEKAAATWKKTRGFHPLGVFADHGPEGSGEPLAVLLRPGNAGSDTAADHIEATRLGLAQLPARLRRRALIRADSAGGTHEFLAWLARPGRRLPYSVGFTITDDIQDAILKIPARAWTPAYDSDREVRPGAWVAELTGLLDLANWPAGMRVIVRKERPHPGAQLRFTDTGGHRFTCFATSTKGGQLADLELPAGGGPGARTGSAARKTQGCAACRCRATPRTRSGARSSRWPAICWPGRRCSPSPARPADGSRNGCGCGSSPAPGASSAAAAASGCASPPPGHGPRRSPRRSPAFRPSRPADQQPAVTTTGKESPRGPVEPARSVRQPACQADPARKSGQRRSLRPPSQDRERCRLVLCAGNSDG
jgi:hypothetical protein